jgi:hypothetical protein
MPIMGVARSWVGFLGKGGERLAEIVGMGVEQRARGRRRQAV